MAFVHGSKDPSRVREQDKEGSKVLGIGAKRVSSKALKECTIIV